MCIIADLTWAERSEEVRKCVDRQRMIFQPMSEAVDDRTLAIG